MSRVPFQVCITSKPTFFLRRHVASLSKHTSRAPIHKHLATLLGSQELRKFRDTLFAFVAVISQGTLVQMELEKDLLDSNILACIVQPWCQREAGHCLFLSAPVRPLGSAFPSMCQVQDTWQCDDKLECSKSGKSSCSYAQQEVVEWTRGFRALWSQFSDH